MVFCSFGEKLRPGGEKGISPAKESTSAVERKMRVPLNGEAVSGTPRAYEGMARVSGTREAKKEARDARSSFRYESS